MASVMERLMVRLSYLESITNQARVALERVRPKPRPTNRGGGFTLTTAEKQDMELVRTLLREHEPPGIVRFHKDYRVDA